MDREDAVLIINGTPTLLAARAVASSASACKRPCTPIGAIKSGEGYSTPKIVVCSAISGFPRVDQVSEVLTAMLRLDASTSIRGINFQLSIATLLARSVAQVPALPKVYKYDAN